MEEQIKKLREAGFTDADIELFVNDQKSRQGQPSAVDPAQVDASQPAPADERVPAYGAPPSASALETVATVGSALAPYAAPAALTAGGLYGASVAKKGFDAMKAASEARTMQAQAQMAQAQGLQQRFEQRMAQRAVPPAGPQIVNASGQPMRAPVVPTAPPAPTMAPPAMTPTPAQPSVMQRGAEIAAKMREIAAQRVMPAVGQAGQMAGRGLAAVANSPVARVGGMAANALYSGGLNTNEEEELRRRRAMPPTITR
jgi:hypothetical protein